MVNGVIVALLFFAVGVLVIGFLVLDALTPGNLRKQVYTLRHADGVQGRVAPLEHQWRRHIRDGKRGNAIGRLALCVGIRLLGSSGALRSVLHAGRWRIASASAEAGSQRLS